MKCKVCGKEAWVKVPSANAAFCKEHYDRYVLRLTEKAIKKFKMFDDDELILVAVSGGKDSLALLHILKRLGYRIQALHINVGIKGNNYSEISEQKAIRYANNLDVPIKIVRVEEIHGLNVIDLAKKRRRISCQVCGLTRRYYMNKYAREIGAPVIATGHTLDDMVQTLFANLLRWDISYLSKEMPLLPSEDGLVRKAKPLTFLQDRETLLYDKLHEIEYASVDCPESRFATFKRYKRLFEALEEESPGTKRQFFQGFIKNIKIFQENKPPYKLEPCLVCGYPTVAKVCSFCRLWYPEKAKGALGKDF